MPKRRIGLQKDVSSIFKTVPLSADDQVATLRRMPILDPPGYAGAAPQQTEISEDLATPACAGAKIASDPALAGPSSPPQQEGAAVKPQPETSAKPEPAVTEPPASRAFLREAFFCGAASRGRHRTCQRRVSSEGLCR